MIAIAPKAPTATTTRPRTYEPFAEVNAVELREALVAVSKAIPKKPTTQILANFLLERHSDKLTLTGFNTEQGISVTIPCSGGAGLPRLTLPAELLKKWLRSLKKGQQYLAISTAIAPAEDMRPNQPDPIRVKFTGYLNSLDNEFTGLSADTYPDLPASDPDEPMPSITLNPEALKQAIAKIQRSIKKPLSNPYEHPLNGIHFKATGTTLLLTACDGTQASQTTLALSQETEEFEASIPANFFKSLNHPALANAPVITLATAPGPSEFDGYVFVENPHIRLTGKTILGKYPDLPNLEEEAPEWTIEIDRRSLMQELAIACLYAETGQEKGLIRLKANAIAQTLTVAGNWTTQEYVTKYKTVEPHDEPQPYQEAVNVPYGRMQSEISANVSEGDDCHLSAHALLKLLESLDSDTIKMAPTFPVLSSDCILLRDESVIHLLVHTNPNKWAVKLEPEPTTELVVDYRGNRIELASTRSSLKFAIALSDPAYLDLLRKPGDDNRIDLTRSEVRSLLERRLYLERRL